MPATMLPRFGSSRCNSSTATFDTAPISRRSSPISNRPTSSTPPSLLAQAFRYGLTAGRQPPDGYHADRILQIIRTTSFRRRQWLPGATWTRCSSSMRRRIRARILAPIPAIKYGLVRVSAEQPSWIPPDAGLVDHLFLLFGLVESLDPNFFADRVFPALTPGDYNADGAVERRRLRRIGDRSLARRPHWRPTATATAESMRPTTYSGERIDVAGVGAAADGCAGAGAQCPIGLVG